jgi:hypothetical protein
VFDDVEEPLSDIVVTLAAGTCPDDLSLPVPAAIVATSTTDENGVYRFEELPERTYCVYMDVLGPELVDLLIPGNWSFPATGVGRYSLVPDRGEQILDLNFGWDFSD